MKQFNYVLKLKMGIHARPAALLADRVKFSDVKVTVECNGRSADGTNVMDLMALKAKKNDVVVVKIEGTEEEKIAKDLEHLFQENF